MEESPHEAIHRGVVGERVGVFEMEVEEVTCPPYGGLWVL